MNTTKGDQKSTNVAAAEILLKTYPYHNLKAAFKQSGKYSEMINYIRLLGLKCITPGCNGTITSPILEYFNYDVSKVKCYNCQKKTLINKFIINI